MATIGWSAPSALSTVLSTGLNSLADGSGADSSTQTPSGSARKQYADVAVTLASLTPGSDAYLELHILPAVDDTPTNFALPDSDTLKATIPLTTTTEAKYKMAEHILIPNRPYKWRLVNEAGVAFASSGNTVAVSTYQEESA